MTLLFNASHNRQKKAERSEAFCDPSLCPCYGFYSRTPNAAAALTFSLCLRTAAKLIRIASIQQIMGPMIEAAEAMAMTHRIRAATQLL
jgi:hypothetical protein